jgi:hypothetical protein
MFDVRFNDDKGSEVVRGLPAVDHVFIARTQEDLVHAGSRASITVTPDCTPTITEAQFPSGDVDIVRNIHSFTSLSVEHIVSIVQCTNDTVFAFDESVLSGLFDLLDDDKSGTIEPDEIIKGVQRPEEREYIDAMNNPEVKQLFGPTRDPDAQREALQGMASKWNLITRAEWLSNFQGMKEKRLLYYKSRTLQVISRIKYEIYKPVCL